MKKNIKKVLALLLIGGAVVGISGCKPNNKPSSSNNSNNPFEMVCYYGCPNSKRVKKLNTKKKEK